MRKMKVPYARLSRQNRIIKKELLNAVKQVLEHGGFTLGAEVKILEERFAALCGVKFAVGVGSGTGALVLVLKALGIGPGDEVITVPNSFFATTSCIALVGARPVFVDVGEDYNLDPMLLEAAITPKTRAIIPVHLTGRPAKMDAIMDIARQRNLYVVEDCAQATGATYHGWKVGSFGNAGCFSMHPLKILNALGGDAGIVTTKDADLYEKLCKMRHHGLKNRNECEFWSFNCKLDTIQAAVLSAKMPYLDQRIKIRRCNADFYRKTLQDVVRVPTEGPGERAVYGTFVIEAEQRDMLQQYLAEHGIETLVHYPIPIHLQQAAKDLGYEVGSFPVAERQARRILSLPIGSELTHAEREYVVDTIQRFYKSSTSQRQAK